MAFDPTTPPSLDKVVKDLVDRVETLEQVQRVPALTVSSSNVTSTVSLLSALTTSYTDFDDSATCVVNVPLSGRLALWYASAFTLEIDGVGPLGLYVAPALSGDNTVAASDANALFVFNSGQGRQVWFVVLTGLTPGETTVTMRCKKVGSSTIVSADLDGQSLIAMPV